MSVTSIAGFQLFSAVMVVGDTAPYSAEGTDASGTPTGEWEVGIGTYTAANELTRTTVLASSNAGSAVVFSAGTKNIFISVPAIMAAWIRERLSANRTYYVRTPAASVSFTASSANVTWTAHGRAVNDAVVLSILPNKGTFTVTIASPGVFTKAAHGYAAGQPLKFSTTGALPTGLTAGTTYYVIATGLTTNTFEVSATVGGSAVNTSGSQSGTHYVEQTGAMPTFSTAGLLVAGTVYYVKTVVDANTVTLSTTAGGTALGTATLATGSPLYVASYGSDSNDGLSTATPLLTPQAALDLIANALSLQGYTATTQLADGVHTGAVTARVLQDYGTVVIQGNAGIPSNVLFSVTSNQCVTAATGSAITVKDMELRTTTGGICLFANAGGVITFSNLVFGACAASHIQAASGGYISASGNYTISGSAVSHVHGTNGGRLTINSVTVTLIGTPAFGSYFAGMSACSSFQSVGATYTGLATGPRYTCNSNGIIDTGGAGTSFLPGDSAGSTATGGQYI